MIGTSLALGLGLAGLGASTATNIIGAKKAASASKDAARMQIEAADRAAGVIKDVYTPYVNYGRQALSTLGRLTAAPPGARFAAPDPTVAPPPPVSPNTFGGRTRPPGAPVVGQAMPRPGINTFGGRAAPPERRVLMQAPDGSTAQIPASQVDAFLQRGARVMES